MQHHETSFSLRLQNPFLSNWLFSIILSFSVYLSSPFFILFLTVLLLFPSSLTFGLVIVYFSVPDLLLILLSFISCLWLCQNSLLIWLTSPLSPISSFSYLLPPPWWSNQTLSLSILPPILLLVPSRRFSAFLSLFLPPFSLFLCLCLFSDSQCLSIHTPHQQLLCRPSFARDVYFMLLSYGSLMTHNCFICLTSWEPGADTARLDLICHHQTESWAKRQIWEWDRQAIETVDARLFAEV